MRITITPINGGTAFEVTTSRGTTPAEYRTMEDSVIYATGLKDGYNAAGHAFGRCVGFTLGKPTLSDAAARREEEEKGSFVMDWLAEGASFDEAVAKWDARVARRNAALAKAR
jgi:hypothetical protein